ncbi:MAG: hypothetical protein ACRD5L_01460, partial [Bryobacteraceae bacterium]
MRFRTKFVINAIVFCSCAFSQSADLDRGTSEIRGFVGTAVDISSFLGTGAGVGGGVEGAVGLN